MTLAIELVFAITFCGGAAAVMLGAYRRSHARPDQTPEVLMLDQVRDDVFGVREQRAASDDTRKIKLRRP